MALSGGLNKAGVASPEINAVATVTLDMVDGKPVVTNSHLVVQVKAAGAIGPHDSRRGASDLA